MTPPNLSEFRNLLSATTVEKLNKLDAGQSLSVAHPLIPLAAC